MVPFDRRKISYIFCRGHVLISRHFGATAKKTKLQKMKIGCRGNVPSIENSKIEVQVVHVLP